jgi:hypothetical protein
LVELLVAMKAGEKADKSAVRWDAYSVTLMVEH